MKLKVAIIIWFGIGLVSYFNTKPLCAATVSAPELARRLGCFACHAAGPGHLAAPLDHVGSNLSAQQLKIALTQPRQLHPGVKMPSYAYLPADEQQTLLNYLESLK